MILKVYQEPVKEESEPIRFRLETDVAETEMRMETVNSSGEKQHVIVRVVLCGDGFLRIDRATHVADDRFVTDKLGRVKIIGEA